MVDVSIIVPIYNVENYIHLLIHDLSMQDYDSAEFLLINDGSTDDTYNRMKGEIRKHNDTRFKLIDKPNGGVSSARNRGLDIAKGKYVIFIDSDDRLDKHFISKYVDSIVGSNSDMSVFSATKVSDGISLEKKGSIDYSEISSKKPISVGEMIKYFSDLKAWGYPFCYISKRSLWKETRFDEHIKFQEDVLAFFNVWNNHPDLNIKINKESYYYYVDREDSALHTMNVNDYWQFVDVDNTIIDMLKKNPNLKNYASFIKALKISSLMSVIAQSILEEDKLNYKKAREEFMNTYFSARYISRKIKIRRLLQYILVAFNFKKIIKLVYQQVYEN